MFRKIIVIIILAFIHVSVHNRFEKELIQVLYGAQRHTIRPSCVFETKPILSKCFGMPSGHSEFAVLFFGSLVKIINPWICALGILGIGLQRILWHRHTVLQVLIGYAIAFIFLLLYVYFYDKSFLLPFVISLVYLFILITLTISVISNKQKQPFPNWMDPSLIDIIKIKQKHTSLSAKIIDYGGHVIMINSDFGFFSWNDLELALDKLCSRVKVKPDLIVGIKTGGGILACYVSKKLGVPYDFIKIRKSYYNCDVRPQGSLEILKDISIAESKKNRPYQVCEHPKHQLRGKRILLIDEISYSGGTIKKAREYLLEHGATIVETMVVSSFTSDEDYFMGKGVAAWPWSFDT